MAKVSVAQLKIWFKKGLKPTQAQFWDWLDSYFHKDDKIPISVVENLQETLDALAGASPEGMATVIDMKPGEYLSDIIASITDASEAKPYTINFYNHSKTIDWTKVTERINWPRHVYLNFVGEIDSWRAGIHVNDFPPHAYSEPNFGLKDNLFIGFSFIYSNYENLTYKTGLPLNLSGLVFGSLDETNAGAPPIEVLRTLDPDGWATGSLGLIHPDDSGGGQYEGGLFKKIGNEFINVTPKFDGCNFVNTNFTASLLYALETHQTVFIKCSFDICYLNYSRLSYTSIENSSLSKADFQRSNLYQTKFERSELKGAIFDNSKLTSVSFNSCDAKEASFVSMSEVYNLFFYLTDLSRARFSNSNFQSSFDFTECKLCGGEFAGATLTGARFIKCDLSQTTLSGASFVNCIFEYCDLRNADLRTDLSGSSLIGCDLSNANLSGISLSNSQLGGITVNENSNFKGSILTGAILPDYLNTKAKFIEKVGDGNVNTGTIWIDGTSILS